MYNLIKIFSILILFLCTKQVFAQKNCNIEKYKQVSFSKCPFFAENSSEVNELKKVEDISSKTLQKRLLIDVLQRDTNIGLTKLRNKTIFRGSFLTYHPSCIEELAQKSKDLTVVNIYSGGIPFGGDLSELERKQFRLFDLDNYLYFQSFHTYTPENEINALIKTLMLTKGDVYIHCFGGVHKTGVLFGIIQRCLNNIPIEDVIEEYRCHAGYHNSNDIGSAREVDEKRIKDYNCSKLIKFLSNK